MEPWIGIIRSKLTTCIFGIQINTYIHTNLKNLFMSFRRYKLRNAVQCIYVFEGSKKCTASSIALIYCQKVRVLTYFELRNVHLTLLYTTCLQFLWQHPIMSGQVSFNVYPMNDHSGCNKVSNNIWWWNCPLKETLSLTLNVSLIVNNTNGTCNRSKYNIIM